MKPPLLKQAEHEEKPENPESPGAEERELYITHPCRRSRRFLKKYILGIIFFSAALYINNTPSVQLFLGEQSLYLVYGLTGLFVLIVLANEITRFSIKYYVTPSRVVEERGIFSRKTNSINLSLVESIKSRANLLERLLVMGDLTLSVEQSEIVFRGIHNPEEVETYLSALIERYRKTPPPNRH
jgi:hypothetical protein